MTIIRRSDRRPVITIELFFPKPHVGGRPSHTSHATLSHPTLHQINTAAITTAEKKITLVKTQVLKSRQVPRKRMHVHATLLCLHKSITVTSRAFKCVWVVWLSIYGNGVASQSGNHSTLIVPEACPDCSVVTTFTRNFPNMEQEKYDDKVVTKWNTK